MSVDRLGVSKLLTALTIMKEVTLWCEEDKPLQVSFSSEGFAVLFSAGYAASGTMRKKRTLYNKYKHIPCITIVNREEVRHFSSTLLHHMTSQSPRPFTLIGSYQSGLCFTWAWDIDFPSAALCFPNVCVFHLRPTRRQKLQAATSCQLALSHHLAKCLQLSLLNTCVT